MDSSDEDDEGNLFLIFKVNQNHTKLYFLDDEERLREELKDLIDDNPIEESEGEDSDAGSRGEKRKKSDDELDDRLEDDDYDLIEENLGVKVERRVCCLFIVKYL